MWEACLVLPDLACVHSTCALSPVLIRLHLAACCPHCRLLALHLSTKLMKHIQQLFLGLRAAIPRLLPRGVAVLTLLPLPHLLQCLWDTPCILHVKRQLVLLRLVQQRPCTEQ
jgi:hypothetical protein